jgi:hypothetical protein
MTTQIKYTEQPEYTAVQKLILEMAQDGTIARFQGACLPASEIIQGVLHARGVTSRILECTALVVNSPSNGNAVHFIGFDSLVPLKPHETDTHIIVLVDAPVPFVVDASIGNKMGSDKLVVVAPLSSTDPDIIATASFKEAKVTYRVRKNVRYFNLHQKTMLERLELDRKTQLNIEKLFVFVKVLLGIGAFNMLANTILIVLKNLGF